MSSIGTSVPSEKMSRNIRACPFDYKIINGRVFVDGQDEGDAQTYFNEGRKLIRYVHLLDTVKRP